MLLLGLATAPPLTYSRPAGFLVLPGFASASEVAALRKRAGELVEAFDPQTISVFTTKNQVPAGPGLATASLGCVAHPPRARQGSMAHTLKKLQTLEFRV